MSSGLPNAEHCKRLAAQIFAQLPEDRSETLLVMAYVQEILLNLGEAWSLRVVELSQLSAHHQTDPVELREASGGGHSGHPGRASPALHLCESVS